MNTLIIYGAKYLIAGVVLVVGYVWLTRRAKLEMAATVVLAGIIALITARLASKLYYDPRPFVSGGIKPLIPHAADNGFPSDHSLLAMTLTAALYFYSRKWAIVAALFTVIIGICRILAHVHSPIDILGAWVIGIASAVLAYELTIFTINRYHKRNYGKKGKHEKDRTNSY